jgi:Flp pilus assembly protein TadG
VKVRSHWLLRESKRVGTHWLLRESKRAWIRQSKGSFHLLAVDESGSAILEFIMVALPLFIPLALYLGAVNGSAQGSLELENIARQVARAFTTSPSEELTLRRANEVLAVYQNQILPTHGSNQLLNLSVLCEAQPCLTPDAKVTITITSQPSGRSASATQVVDAWRNSP